MIKVSPTTTFRSGSLIINDVSGGDENLILARIAERMAGEGDGEERYLASIARCFKLRIGGGGKSSGRVFSWTMKNIFRIQKKVKLQGSKLTTNRCCQ